MASGKGDAGSSLANIEPEQRFANDTFNPTVSSSASRLVVLLRLIYGWSIVVLEIKDQHNLFKILLIRHTYVYILYIYNRKTD